MMNKLYKQSEKIFKKEININEQLHFNKKNLEERLPTPEKVKDEIKAINNEESIQTNINYNKYKKELKYYAVCSLFIDEYDLLLISSTNNIISAWKYDKYKRDFKNINKDDSINEKELNKKELNIPLYISKLPQYTMCYEKESKYIFTGQEDGKIFKWKIDSNKPVYIFEISKLTENKINKAIKKNINISL